MTDSKSDDILSLITADHREVDEYFVRLESASEAEEVYEYLNRIYKELTLHAQAEESVFYPALQKYEDAKNLVEEAKAEHSEMKVLLEDIQAAKPNSNEFRDTLRQLKEAVRHHVEEEESDVFTMVRRHISDQQLRALAQEFKTAKLQMVDEVEAAMVSSP
ncbi:hemerythrin domain-containing protein [Oculatella sp. LEGE 06141]|uniref:hemerythrin domain-containing protein n=1 Tax=Oculatella sp. LEGE 06141 TaxID=1828648 RepID=UPI0018817E1F|nr:hemerythrin domain-containing protein [Oculatella sp. LEGE 06141]MBE9179664.1 hemerythrin domain-containing protein [Oculatella sp. LEGE 06141]